MDMPRQPSQLKSGSLYGKYRRAGHGIQEHKGNFTSISVLSRNIQIISVIILSSIIRFLAHPPTLITRNDNISVSVIHPSVKDRMLQYASLS